MNTIPNYLRPSPQQIEAACRAYYAADRKAGQLEQEANRARAAAEALRLTALGLCERERKWSQ